jgi:hypothetical protein
MQHVHIISNEYGVCREKVTAEWEKTVCAGTRQIQL